MGGPGGRETAEAWSGLGATYIRDPANRAAGIAALEKSLELDPAGEEAAFYLAQLWANDGAFARARKLAQALLARTSSETMKGQLTSVLESIDRQENPRKKAAEMRKR